MDWMLSSGGAPSMVLIPLGIRYNNQYYISIHCLSYLDDLIVQLKTDDKKTHSRRRGLGYVDIINTDLKPILILSSKNDEPKIFRSAVRLLAEISTPIECLVFEETVNHANGKSPNVIYELTQLLYKCKEAFLDLSVIQAIMHNLEHLLEKQALSSEETIFITFALVLFRNVLHAPERQPGAQQKLLCNLFSQKFDGFLLKLLACPQKGDWAAVITQIISVIFKDQPVENIQNRLRIKMETSGSENYDESNNSSDEVGQNSTPNEVSTFLDQFVVDFMLDGYNVVVGILHLQLLRDKNVPLDKPQFFWLIAYFLGFASILKLDLQSITNVLHIDILCYLTWEAVCEIGRLDKNTLQRSMDANPRRIHRCVRAIREYLQACQVYSRLDSTRVNISGPGSSHEYQRWSYLLRGYLPAMRELRQLFVLLLRQFNPKFHCRRLLSDMITGNHLLLTTLKQANDFPASVPRFDMMTEHLSQFCTKTILARYGSALSDFRTNGPFLNDSIFTILLHVKNDLGKIDLLLHPVVLRPFVKIWEESFDICDNWHTLIECVLQTFWKNHRSGNYSIGSYPWNTTTDGLADEENLTLTKAKHPAGNNISSFNVLHTDTQSVVNQLKNSGFQKQLIWIQSSLLAACSARLGTYVGQEFRNPIASLSLRTNMPCPIIPWTEEESFALNSDLFHSLIFQIGLIPPTSCDSVYPCIPREWSADTVYKVALVFGNVDQQNIDFDLACVCKSQLNNRAVGPLFDISTDGFHQRICQMSAEKEQKQDELLASLPEVSFNVWEWMEKSAELGEIWAPEIEDAAISDMANGVNALGFFDEFSSREDEECAME
ncbi:putative TIMELESS/TIM-1 protein [Daphnia pulex]|uniref:Putative TIMELESS/TIM-1 protein n=1 Tax=Daphnia pulex TaxID=6669 RepID=E9GI54_DAPPU|nr:putative TIMELESS/TIM-1 protein [Daphnia pulex]|eukprot:EFX80829.1 putative TIMELESS/TIM-1 protein [Daphnia pulex]